MNMNEPKPPAKEWVNDILTRHWKLLIAIFVGTALAMAGILILMPMNKTYKAGASMLAEDIQTAYEEWSVQSGEERSDEELQALFETANSEYPRTFAVQKTLFITGLMAMDEERWDDAYTVFTTLADDYPESYLAPTGLFNAGSAAESAGNDADAAAAWKKIADQYSSTFGAAPEVLFNLGRIEEKGNDFETALEYYNSLLVKFPNSEWTDYAKGRILKIENS